ncbi:hypothetical protein EG68_00556 [Paragonimus skrjabini miyazakii]|uniref:UPF0506 domain-containing protein n=1 Tax=Paragonimus skrjabini miyazakii TaxID=59628 RepID=A0A8S9Z3M7_9TREM|nr:hypothetical protein EG68_00556 [Paragonimus skrjabini miyazakii]
MGNPNATSAKCVPVNGTCDGTLFHRCCGSLKCDLHGPFAGICRSCSLPGASCVNSSQCCSGQCKQLSCTEV